MKGGAVDPRLAGLPAALVPRMHEAARAIRDGQLDAADAALAAVLASVPDHPEALRLSGVRLSRLGRPAEARAVFERAQALRPSDAILLSDLAGAMYDAGDREAAFAAWRRATKLAPKAPMPWFNLGRNLQLEGRTEPALQALNKARLLDPKLVPAHVLAGDALTYVGKFDDAAAAYRAALRVDPACGDAWRGLGNIKTRPMTDADRAQLTAQLQRPEVREPDRVGMGYALGKLCEDQGRYAEAFAALTDANQRLQRVAKWNAAGHRAFTDALIAACDPLPAPIDPALGREVIFLVGLPRSGSTLFEQILAAHPEVEGASELPELDAIIAGESRRRGAAFPAWVGAATAEDWHRLGRDYLARTARWRERRPRLTDKLPENWKYAGVLRAMLPGAKMIETRRDPLEVAWYCYKQYFYRLPHFSCDFDDLASYLRDCERALATWRALDPTRIGLRSYEALVADPEGEIRGLLAFCELAFDPRCLEFHRAERSVRTPSASQVRQPIRGDTARAASYGDALLPLRAALARAGD